MHDTDTRYLTIQLQADVVWMRFNGVNQCRIMVVPSS